MFSLDDKLSDLPAVKRRELERVARILFDEFGEAQKGKLSPKRKHGQILKLILFGSYARGGWVEDRKSGYLSDYDLLVIVSSETFTDVDEFWRKAEDRIAQELTVTGNIRTPVNFIVHAYHDVNDQLSQGRPFFLDIARDGIVLYEVEGFPLASPRPLSTEDIRAEAKRHFDQWFSSAAYNQKLADYAVGDGQFNHAAFNLHQATERLYHCVLLVLTLYSPKLHRLEKLRSQAEGIDARLIEAWPRDTKFARRGFTRLDRAYVDARYSAHYEITTEELNWLIERIKVLQAIVKDVCEEKLRVDD
jgi:predicted nucleotidyltransferase/HEPN domain-containing protein